MGNEKRKYQFSAFSIIVSFALLGLIGISLSPFTSLRLNPSQNTPQLQIDYQWLGASSRILESTVTYRLEDALSFIEGVKNIHSTSAKDIGNVTLTFDDGIDLETTRLKIATIIKQLYPKFPNGVSYPSITQGSKEDANKTLLILGLNGQPAKKLEYYAKEVLQAKIAKIDGINQVSVQGISTYEYVINCNLKQLRHLKISFTQVAQSIRDFYQKEEVGKIAIDNHLRQLTIRTDITEAQTISLNEIPITNSNNEIIDLNNVATIQRRKQTDKGYKHLNGLNALTLHIEAEKGANQLRIRDAITPLLQTNTPLSLNVLYDATLVLKKELETIALRTLFSVIILLLFVYLINRNLKYVFIISVTLTTNLAIAIILYYLLQIDIHIYSLAGLTISLGIVIDNALIMVDHLVQRKNRKVFISIFAATLTTIGALSIIFFLDAAYQFYLIDFVWIVVINLSVSLITSLFLIPSLAIRLHLEKRNTMYSFRRRKAIVQFSRLYTHILTIFLQKKKWAVTGFILLFGLPLFLLPKEISTEKSMFATTLNSLLDNEFYRKNIQPNFKYLGGTLYYFVEGNEGYSFSNKHTKPEIYIRFIGVEGTTYEQMDAAVIKIENYLQQFQEIEHFETQLSNAKQAIIEVFFKKEMTNQSFPLTLERKLSGEVQKIGGIDFMVYGISKTMFHNNIYFGADAHITLEGYNLDELLQHTEAIKDTILSKQPRIHHVNIGKVNKGFQLALSDNSALERNNLTSQTLYTTVKNNSGNSTTIKQYNGEPIKLSISNQPIDVWQLNNYPITTTSNTIRVKDLAKIQEHELTNAIKKENKQYLLDLNYDFRGTHKLSEKVKKKLVKEINDVLPTGYKAADPNDRNRRPDDYFYLKMAIAVLLVIYFICAILFESLWQPFAVILTIPFSFIGVFITFPLFNLRFDEGGIASLLMLSGIVVNASIYIISDINTNSKQLDLRAYLKSYHHKIIPILLTITSTILGLLPFVIWNDSTFFWKSFAGGTIGGLLFSLIVIFFFLPVCLRVKPTLKNKGCD